MPDGAGRCLVALQKFPSRLQGERRKKFTLGIESDPPGGLEKPHPTLLFLPSLLNILENLLQSN